uniref:Uncharacterized protein n=1 Tax=Pelodiscus sinensis TaxID=13735 RepID=K7GFM6_PELSI
SGDLSPAGAMVSAAATNDLLKSLQDSVNCCVCQDVFKDPVTLDCGHNFCRSCITQRWEGLKRNFPCPQCRKRFRKRNMRPNSQLEEIAKQVLAPAVKGLEGEKLHETHKKAKQVPALAVKQSEGKKMCEKHKKPWTLFCEDDKELTCVDCHMSHKHRRHYVLPIEDAAKAYKQEINLRLNYFKKEKERMLTLKANEDKKIDTLLTQTATERKEITSYFGQQHRILKYEEQCLMERLDEIDQTILKLKYEWFAGFMEKMLPLENVISNIEQKCQQPVTEFLKGIQSNLSRCDQGWPAAPLWVAGVGRNGIYHSFNSALSCLLMKGIKLKKATQDLQHQKDAPPHLGWSITSFSSKPRACSYMDSLKVVGGSPQSLLPSPPRGFDPSCYVLGSEGFTAGRHYWEVEVGDKEEWAIGVARESVTHKTPSDLIPEEGIWCVWMSQNTIHPSYWAHCPNVPERQRKTVLRIRVCLDYERGWVTFYRTDNMAAPITYCTSFTEKIFPIFWVCSQGTCLRLCP